MASSICHTRSNSLPSRSHPFVSEIDEHFCRLKANSEATSSSSVCHKLNGLQDLYDCVDKLLLLPTLVQEKNDHECVNELLDGSLRIFDLCSTAKDVLLQIKEFTQELQSILRRRGDVKLISEIKKYLTSRKVVRKAIKKAFANSKAKKLDNDNESQAMARILKEVEAISLTVFLSLLSFISGPKAQSRLSGWSLVSKLTHNKQVASEDGETDQANEFAKVDAALLSLIDQKICIGDVQKQLKKLEFCIQDFDEGLDCLSRSLIKTRVSLLNALNN
ncbi:hypothetical protein Dsin_013772 [Dipteronia sinensis]|uniref:Uncharacterized protein n=1 Tax=Dipteronia sinensis TaxID=43782 RepID=A0AAE0E9R6_9ROSI|nr:hypothetical protein Dsin_013772 [Dipteronia sinensis]